MRVRLQAHSTFAAALCAAALLGGAAAQAQDDYSGVFKAAYTKQEAMPINGPQGHVIVLSNAQATHKSTGKQEYFDSGKVTVQDYVDIVNGNGTHSGYITFESPNGERTVSRLTGAVKTVLAADGKTPITTVEGTFEQVFGTNLYGSLKPVGVYKTQMLSPTEYQTEWKVTKFN